MKAGWGFCRWEPKAGSLETAGQLAGRLGLEEEDGGERSVKVALPNVDDLLGVSVDACHSEVTALA
jgi:hypothetical protein